MVVAYELASNGRSSPVAELECPSRQGLRSELERQSQLMLLSSCRWGLLCALANWCPLGCPLECLLECRWMLACALERRAECSWAVGLACRCQLALKFELEMRLQLMFPSLYRQLCELASWLECHSGCE